jgi:hypothetical protein
MAKLAVTTTIIPNKVCILFKEDRITLRGPNEQSNALAAIFQEIRIKKGGRAPVEFRSRHCRIRIEKSLR